MKVIKNILFLLCMGLVVVSCNSDEKESVFATEINNLTLQSKPGNIKLNWEYMEGDNTNRYVEIRYYDPAKRKDILKTISGLNTSFTIEDTRKKYGEYSFRVQPFSTTFTPGTVQTISGTSEAAPIIDSFTSQEIVPASSQISIAGQKPDGTMVANPIADGGKIENLLDNNESTFVNASYSGVPTGTIYWLDVAYDNSQEYLKFSYITRNHAQASFPAIIECYVKVDENDEWTLIKTLKLEDDKLPTTALTSYVSGEYKAPFAFKYFRFKVLETHTGKVNFSLAEFRVYDVKYHFYDPEA